jgi:hypothetical protein
MPHLHEIESRAVGPTPGPWSCSGKIDQVDGYDLWCGSIAPVSAPKYRGEIARVQSADHIGGISAIEALANARLLAAAPEFDAAAGLAITALSFAVETYQRANDAVALAQTLAAKEALIAAQNKARGREPQMRDVTPSRTPAEKLEG